MVAREVLIEKGLKLYNLTSSDNENEASLAKDMLDKFLKKHKLTLQDVVDAQFIVFELSCEDKYEMFLFNHLLIKSVEDTDLMEKIKVKQMSEVSCRYELSKYLHTSIYSKYLKILDTYKISKQEVIHKIEFDKKNITTSPLKINWCGQIFEIEQFIDEGLPVQAEFNEYLFFISFIRKYSLIPRPKSTQGENPEGQKTLTEEEVRMIMRFEKMYNKQSFNEEIEGGVKMIDDFPLD